MKARTTAKTVLFPFIYSVTKSVSHDHPLIILLQLLYLPFLLLVFYLSQRSNTQDTSLLLQNHYFLLAGAIFTGILFLQVSFAIIYHIHLVLYQQFSLFRYIIFPFLLASLATEIKDPNLLPNSLSIVLFLILVVLVLFLAHLLLQPNCMERQLWKMPKLQDSLLVSDILLTLRIAVPSGLWRIILLIIWLIVSVREYECVKNWPGKAGISEKLLGIAVFFKQYLFCLSLLKQLFLSEEETITLLLYSWPAVVMLAGIRVFKKEKIIVDWQIFNGQATDVAFRNIIRMMGDELTRFKNNQNLPFQQSFLMVFIAEHQYRCTVSTCSLLQPSTQEELRNCAQPNSMKILIHKVTKKIQELCILYMNKNPTSLQTRLLLLYFYVNHLPNRLKIMQMMASMSSSSFGWQQQLVIFSLERQAQSIEAAEVIDSSREDDFQEFKKQLSGTLSCLREFWQQLMEEKVDLNQLMAISARLFPLKQAVEATWKRHLNQQKFSSWNILRTYVLYRRSILHDYTNACILDDYCKIVEQRLKAKHQLGYINSQTQQGVMAISLTESSLGNISSLNNQTCKLFNYAARGELLQMRVNDIMPSVYSELHDNILGSFLKNRYKQINQDQRFVFGKNKNGFIFPILLQLRKLSWNANDELIFIANIEPAKIKAAPIFCITDLEGDIQDYTSTFARLFLKKIRQKFQIKRKNIQELIPSFFQVIEQEQEKETQSRHFSFSEKGICNKHGQFIEIDFTATNLVIKDQQVGYLVEGHNIYPQRTVKQKNDLSSLLRAGGQIQQLYRNTFNPLTLSYELATNSEKIGKRNILNEFTIPFLKTSDFQSIITLNHQHSKVYGTGIKTLRYFAGRLEHLPQEESFHSEDNNEQWRQKSVLTRIRQMREEISVQDTKNLGYTYKILILSITTIAIIISGITLYSLSLFEQSEQTEHLSLFYKWEIRSLFAEHAAYLTSTSSAPSLESIKNIQKELVQNLVASGIEEWQKEGVLKILAGGESNLKNSLNPSFLNYSLAQSNAEEGIVQLLYTSCGLQALLILVAMGMFLLYKHTMKNIYLILLSISDKKLHSIHQDSLTLATHLSPHQEQNIKSQQIPPPLPEEEQFERVKKFKNDYSHQDAKLFSQLTFPSLTMLLYVLFAAIIVETDLADYQKQAQIWKQGSQLLPQSAMTLTQTLLKQTGYGNFSLSDHFIDKLQQFERNALLADFSSQQALLQLMKGDPCKLKNLQQLSMSDPTLLCSQILQHGVSNALNLLIISLTNKSPISDWSRIIKLEFQMLKPLLKHTVSVLSSAIIDRRSQLQNLTTIVSLVNIGLCILTAIYLFNYPIQSITQQLLFTKDLISIVPSNRETNPENALATLTTEAIQTY